MSEKPKSTRYLFTWNGHTVKWELTPELRADVTSETTSVPYHADNAIRFMVAYNIKHLCYEIQHEKHDFKRQFESGH